MPQPIIFQDLSGIAQGITSGSSVLAQALGQRMQERKKQEQQRQYGSVLQNVLGGLSPDSSPIDITKALTAGLNQGVPPEIVQNYGNLYATLQKSQKAMPAGPQEIENMSTLFAKFGMPEDVANRNAELWGKLTTGGQTEMAKLLVDQIARQQYSPIQQQGIQPQVYQEQPEEQKERFPVARQQYSPIQQQGMQPQVYQEQPEEQKERFPELNTFENLTPKEKVTKSADLRKENLPHYSKSIEQIKGVGDEKFRLQELASLNEKNTLPTGFGKYNVNFKTGELIYPGLANADTQRYVKLINDFTVKAKETFGSRVTNFELQKFLQRLPNLSGTPEGRASILRQMEIIGDLNEAYYSTLANTYENYKLGNIEQEDANKISRRFIKEKEQKLIDEYRQNEIRLDKMQQDAVEKQMQESGMKNVGFFENLPKKAKEGSTAVNQQTNKSYKFIDGKWRIQK